MLMDILLWLGIIVASPVVYAGAILLFAPRQQGTGFIDWHRM